MTSAYILVVAILILGGLIAALGDRIGTKVGKARLRIGNLRPKQTAIVFTVITGTIISASTLAILFAFSKSLRQGIFQLDEILQKRRHVQAELNQVNEQKNKVEQELQSAEVRQREAKNQVLETEKKLQQTEQQLKDISKQAVQLREGVKKILKERQRLVEQQKNLTQQSRELQERVRKRDQELSSKQQEINAQDQILQQQEGKLQTLESEQETLQLEIDTRDQKIRALDESIALQDSKIEEREQKLTNLESELNFLQKQVEILAQYYQTYQELRERPIALIKGQVLAIGLIRVTQEQNLEETIDKLLRQANLNAIEALGYDPNTNQRVVQVTTAQVEQIKQQLTQKGEYLVRIITAGNYVQRERQVRIFADIAPNKEIYSKEQVIANVPLNIENLTAKELEERLDFLLSVAQFRARRSGVLGKIFIADGKVISIVNFLQELQELRGSIQEIQAITTEKTYTSGPLQITLVVIAKNGEELLRL